MKKIILTLLFVILNSTVSYSDDLEESVYVSPIKNIKVIRKYDKENLISVTEYFPYNSPDIKIITNYKNNLKNGEYLEYYPDGILKKKINYNDDFLEGEFTRYYASGKITYNTNFFKNGYNWIIDGEIVSIDSLYSCWINGANLYAVMEKDNIGQKAKIGYYGEDRLNKYPGELIGLKPLRADVNCQYEDICQKDKGIIRSLKFIDKEDIKKWDTSWYPEGELKSNYYQVLQDVNFEAYKAFVPNYKSKFLEAKLIKKVETSKGSVGGQAYYYIYALFEQDGEKVIAPIISFDSEDEAYDYLLRYN